MSERDGDERAPICPVCGVTMLPAALAEHAPATADWVCVECEETREAGDETY